jgi:16S rRNA (guanine527-N7)-methyltransferase
LSDHSETLHAFVEQLRHFNTSHNLISRASPEDILERHVRHCLFLASRAFPAGCTVVDWGTGGGLPAIPLAIVFPEVRFVAVDAAEKKVRAVRAMARRLGLSNLDTWHGRAEEWSGPAHYSVSRATAPLATLWGWHVRIAAPLAGMGDACWPPGLVCLKGGDLSGEFADLTAAHGTLRAEVIPLEDLGASAYFEEKVIVQIAQPAP